jgi:aspartate-semialdehyde dehydrogenase
MEDGGRDKEDSRSQDQAHRDLRSCAGIRRPFRSGQYRVWAAAPRRRSARDFAQRPGCLVIDKREDGGYVTPYECVGEDATYISRIREDVTIENGLQMWIVSDNLRKGAALNAVQIAECLVNRKLIQAKRRAA